MDLASLARKNLIFLTRTGSHAYGMATAHSDVDTRGIFLPPAVTRDSPFFVIDQVEKKDDAVDEVIYNLKKFIKLYTDMNPNILELLWVDESDILVHHPAYDRLKSVREALLSTKVRHTFTGYAHAQLQRIKGHNKWINNPQTENPPSRADFVKVIYDPGNNCVTEHYALPELYGYRLYKLYGTVYALNKERGAKILRHDGTLDIVEDYGNVPGFVEHIVFFDEQQYELAFNNWKSYWDWKKNRNEVRSELEIKHGYDTKHASHCVRLLRMGGEILEGKGVLVKRPDAKELLAIRGGAWSYEKVLDYAKEMEEKIETLYKTSPLPHSSDTRLANDILMEILNDFQYD